jgi:hypothetical protein
LSLPRIFEHPFSKYSVDEPTGHGSAVVESTQAPQTNGRSCPPCGFPYKRDGVWVQRYYLPLDSIQNPGIHEYLIELSLGEEKHELTQSEAHGRPLPGKSSVVDKWIKWQIQRYQNLAIDPDENKDYRIHESLSRCSWESVNKQFLSHTGKEAQVSLIVKLAQNNNLLKALDHISHHPRRVLQRIRQEVPLAKLREMDSACVRSYAIKPGRTEIEKAGSRQTLLGLVRQEFFNTLENRITLWVLNSMVFMSMEYKERFKEAGEGDVKITQVTRLLKKCHQWALRLIEFGVTPYEEPTSNPNYSLQFDKNYRHIWKAYVAIRRQERLIDEAWTWQRVMWSNTCRLILYSTLITTKDKPMTELYTNGSVYIQDESFGGKWQLSPFGPGPFIKRNWELIDSWDLKTHDLKYLTKAYPEIKEIGQYGPEMLFISKKDVTDIVLVWISTYRSRKTTVEELIKECELPNDSRYVNYHGILMVIDQDSEPLKKVDAYQSDDSRLNAITVPPNLQEQKKYLEDFFAGIGIIKEVFE